MEQKFNDLVGEVLLFTNCELVLETHRKEGTQSKYDSEIREAKERIKNRIVERYLK